MSDELKRLTGILGTGQSLNEQNLRTFLLSLLRVADSIDRMVREGQTSCDQLELLSRQLAAVLESQGIRHVECVGRKFDPEKHFSEGRRTDCGTEPGVIVEESQRGYEWDEEILRPARVYVSA